MEPVLIAHQQVKDEESVVHKHSGILYNSRKKKMTFVVK